jgi:transcription antitermination protein NusB
MTEASSSATPASAPTGVLPKSKPRSPRRRAREFAVQALYQHFVGQQDVDAIDTFTRDLQGFAKCDSLHYDALVRGCVSQAKALDALITPRLDRPMAEISPIEHSVLWIGAYELGHCLDVPYRSVLNECIELAKDFGGTDGFKYVNGVLHQLAPVLRELEVNAAGQHAKPKKPRAPPAEPSNDVS